MYKNNINFHAIFISSNAPIPLPIISVLSNPKQGYKEISYFTPFEDFFNELILSATEFASWSVNNPLIVIVP